MTRQVRLDDDVAAFVELGADGLSLSGATNRLIRSLAGARAPVEPQERPEPVVAAILPDPPPVPVERPDPTRVVDGWGRLIHDPSHGERRQEPTKVRRARGPGRRLCRHPLGMRVGLRCGACGATMRR